jgi:hypothetical protein
LVDFQHATQLQEMEQNCAEMKANREKTNEMAAALELAQAQVAEMSVHASPGLTFCYFNFDALSILIHISYLVVSEALAARAQLDQERSAEISTLQSEIHKLKARNQMYEACIEELATVRKVLALQPFPLNTHLS